MRILLFAHPGFFSKGEPGAGRELAWIRLYARGLRSLGAETAYFAPLTDRIGAFDWVHVFSRQDPGTWHSLAESGARIAVTPSLDPGTPLAPGRLERAGALAVSGARALLQRRWPPREDSRLFPGRGVGEAGGARFLVISEAWVEHVRRWWQVPPAAIHPLEEDPEAAARAAAAIFGLPGRAVPKKLPQFK